MKTLIVLIINDIIILIALFGSNLYEFFTIKKFLKKHNIRLTWFHFTTYYYYAIFDFIRLKNIEVEK